MAKKLRINAQPLDDLRRGLKPLSHLIHGTEPRKPSYMFAEEPPIFRREEWHHACYAQNSKGIYVLIYVSEPDYDNARARLIRTREFISEDFSSRYRVSSGFMGFPKNAITMTSLDLKELIRALSFENGLYKNEKEHDNNSPRSRPVRFSI